MEEIYNLLSFYYQKNPDSMLPLLMAAAAARNQLNIKLTKGSFQWKNRYREQNSELATRIALFDIDLVDASNSEWISGDKRFYDMIQHGLDHEYNSISVNIGFDEELIWCMNRVLEYEDVFVPRYHFKQGRVIHHSYNEKEENLQRNYAGIRLALALDDCSKKNLRMEFVPLANKIVEMASIQPRRDRLKVVRTLAALLDYNGTGTVYVPFAGTGLMPAMIGAGRNMYADGGGIEYEYIAGLLVNYGAGGSNEHFRQRNSYDWCEIPHPDYIACTYLGNTGGDNPQPAMSFCLEQCMNRKNWHGRLAATIQSQFIFDYFHSPFSGVTDWWGNALKRNWVDTIIALPIGEVCVLFDGNREKQNKIITFIDCTNPLIEGRDIKDLLKLEKYHQTVKVKDAKKPGFLRSLIAPEVHPISGFTNIRLSEVLRPLKKGCHLMNDRNDEGKIQISLAGTGGLRRTLINTLYEPSYHLTQNSIIIPCEGCPNPIFFNAEMGDAYLTEGYAFEMVNPEDKDWIMRELKEEYVVHQLHPYGYNALTPPHFSSNEFLSLILRRQTSDTTGMDDALPSKFIITEGEYRYEIGKVLGCGGFGITYEAKEKNNRTGVERKVAIKEFFMRNVNSRLAGGAVKTNARDYLKVKGFRENFIQEATMMAKLGAEPSNHIMYVEREFESSQTYTNYYVMKEYSKGSLLDMILANQVPPSDIVYSHIIEPLCTAIGVIHSNHCAHLDIKPENILLDDDGYATLIDFGLAKAYKKNGLAKTNSSRGGTLKFEAPEQIKGNMGKFEKRADIYSLAATLYYTFTLQYADSIPPADTEVEPALRKKLCNVSPKMQDAIIKGLSESPEGRQSSIDEFLGMLA